MLTKGPGPDEILLLGEADDPALATWYRLMRLKRLFRQGWLRRGLAPEVVESVADHSFGAAILVLLTAPAEPGLDVSRAALMALAHELGEAYAGDLTPSDGVAPEEKRRREAASMDRALEGLEDGAAAFLRGLWEEYEGGESPEARFVKQVDRLEMGLQAALHHAEGRKGMEEFFTSAEKALETPRLVAMLAQAKALANA